MGARSQMARASPRPLARRRYYCLCELCDTDLVLLHFIFIFVLIMCSLTFSLGEH